MDQELYQFINSRITTPEAVDGDKIMDLATAVTKFVKPGMSIQTGNSMAFPSAIYYEIARQFWGKEPNFTLIGNTGGSFSFALFAFGKLCNRIISGFNGDGYPFPAPNPMLTRAFKNGDVIPESWTFLTLAQRLMAGAMGLPFFPTKSISGSSMEDENKAAFKKASNPFNPQESVGLLKALNPDIALAHGWAADENGNTILGLPYTFNHYGALAARKGVIVTVEKIVDADFIRRHSYLTRLPGHVVKAVCPVPFGGHPIGLHALGLPEFEGYGEDEEFTLEARKASKDEDDYQKWIDKWVLGCKDHGEFISRLGQRRVWFLMGRIHKNSWKSELAEAAPRLIHPKTPTPAERLVIGAAEKLTDIVKKNGHKLLLCGIGVSNLASWMAYFDLRRQNVLLELLAEIGFYGYAPQPADPFLFNLRNLPSSRMTSDISTTLGIFMCGFQSASIGVLGAGQIDRFGNVNTTKVTADGPYLVGSGGANDVASGASEVMITMDQNKKRFVEKVPYITSPGTKVTTVATQNGIFEKPIGHHELELSVYFENPAHGSEQETIAAISAQCAWPLKIREPLKILPTPTDEQIKFLRCFDPKRLFLGGPESKR
jgi:acyl CoA:acetate/3-ketoacid CoA transferase alpha subunit